jgi:hypothetical protein
VSLYFFRIQEVTCPPRLENVIRYSSFSTTVELSAAAATATPDPLPAAAADPADAFGAAVCPAEGATAAADVCCSAGAVAAGCWLRQYCSPKMTLIMTIIMIRKERLSWLPPPL